MASTRNELAHQPVDSLGCGSAALSQSAGLGDIDFGLMPEHFGEQDVLGGEVIVDQAAADLGRLGDVSDAGVRQASLEHYLLGGRQKFGSALLHLLAARRLYRPRVCHQGNLPPPDEEFIKNCLIIQSIFDRYRPSTPWPPEPV